MDEGGGNDQVYDIDGQIGPFFDTVYDELLLHVDYEEEIGIGNTKQALDIPPHPHPTPDVDLTRDYVKK